MGSRAFFCLAFALASFWGFYGESAELMVGFGHDKPPFIIEARKSGIEVDIVREILRRMDITMNPKFMGRERLADSIVAGDIAMGSGMRSEDTRIVFSAVFSLYHNVAMTRKSDNITLKVIEDLSKYSVTAWQGASKDLGDRFGAAVEKSPLYREYPYQQQQIKSFLYKRYQVVVSDRSIFSWFVNSLKNEVPDVDLAFTVHEIFPASTGYSAGFRDPALRDAFNAKLEEVKKDGTFDKIIKSYQNY